MPKYTSYKSCSGGGFFFDFYTLVKTLQTAKKTKRKEGKEAQIKQHPRYQTSR
jgi:hypothetical protein